MIVQTTQQDTAILVENVTRRYRLYTKPFDRLKEVLVFGQRSFHREFTALDAMNIKVKPGETPRRFRFCTASACRSW